MGPVGEDRPTRHPGGFATRAVGTDEGVVPPAVLQPKAAPAQMRSGREASALLSSCSAQLLCAELCLWEGFSFMGWVFLLAALFTEE